MLQGSQIRLNVIRRLQFSVFDIFAVGKICNIHIELFKMLGGKISTKNQKIFGDYFIFNQFEMVPCEKFLVTLNYVKIAKLGLQM